MIIQDKQNYMEYIKKAEEKANKIYSSINWAAIPESYKKDIESIRSKIFGKLVVISVNLNAGELIAPSDWEQCTKQIDGLCKDLSDKVNEAIAYSSHTQANIR